MNTYTETQLFAIARSQGKIALVKIIEKLGLILEEQQKQMTVRALTLLILELQSKPAAKQPNVVNGLTSREYWTIRGFFNRTPAELLRNLPVTESFAANAISIARTLEQFAAAAESADERTAWELALKWWANVSTQVQMSVIRSLSK